MKNHVYGAEKGSGEKVTEWLNGQAEDSGITLKVKLENSILTTQNFGDFDLFSLSGDSVASRKLLSKAGKRFGIRMVEGGYKEVARIIKRRKSDYAKVLKGDKVIGHLELETSRFGATKWEVKSEERR